MDVSEISRLLFTALRPRGCLASWSEAYTGSRLTGFEVVKRELRGHNASGEMRQWRARLTEDSYMHTTSRAFLCDVMLAALADPRARRLSLVV